MADAETTAAGDSAASVVDSTAQTLTRQSRSALATKSAAARDFDAAVDWCTKGLRLLSDADSTEPVTVHATLVLRARRAEYALQAGRLEDAVGDADAVLRGLMGASDRKTLGKVVRVQCRALLALDRRDEALDAWREHLGMASPVLDELAFRREFGVKGETSEDDDPRYDQYLLYLYRRDFGNTINLLSKTLDASRKGKGKSKNKDPVLFLLRARCRIELKEFGGAVADAERVVTLLPTAVEAYRWLCEALIALNKYGQASKVCQAGLTVSPTDQSLLALEDKLEGTKQECDERRRREAEKKESRRVLKSGTESGDELNPALSNEGVDAEVDGDEEAKKEEEDPAYAAIRDLKRAIKADPSNAELYWRMARLRLDLKQYEQAQSDATQAIAVDSTFIDGYLCSCEALYVLRRYAKALKVCEQGQRMVDPKDEGVVEMLHDWNSKLQDALVDPPPEELLHDATPEQKSRVPKAVARRRNERAQRKVNDAQALRSKCLEKAVELAHDRDFGNAVFWLNKAEGYEAAGGDFGAAQIFSLRARCRFELKQFEHVTKDAEKAITLEPTNAETYRWLCLSLKVRGMKEKARAACVAGLQVDPTHQALQSLRRGLENTKRR